MRMLVDRSGLVRLLLVAATMFAAVAWPTHHSVAYAAGDDDDDDGGGGDDDGAKGGGDDDSDANAEDEVEEDQPPVTAGGLYSKSNYPVSVVERPLTVIEGMTEVHLGL